MSRIVIGRVHLVAGVLAFALICTFWTSTVVSELFGSAATVAAVKAAILWGMLALIPAMAAVGGTGFRLGGKSKAPLVAAKRRRMPVIALNGILILVPSAFFLAARAGAGQFLTFKRSSQHPNHGDCDGHSKATITPVWTRAVAIAGSTA